MDANVLGDDVHHINILTAIASESYDSFAKSLQAEIAEGIADCPCAITVELFVGKVIKDEEGNEQVVDHAMASAIHYDMIVNGYIDRKSILTDKYYEDKANNEIKVAKEAADCAASVLAIIGKNSRKFFLSSGKTSKLESLKKHIEFIISDQYESYEEAKKRYTFLFMFIKSNRD